MINWITSSQRPQQQPPPPHRSNNQFLIIISKIAESHKNLVNAIGIRINVLQSEQSKFSHEIVICFGFCFFLFLFLHLVSLSLDHHRFVGSLLRRSIPAFAQVIITRERFANRHLSSRMNIIDLSETRRARASSSSCCACKLMIFFHWLWLMAGG